MSKKAKGKTIPEIWQAFARATIKLDKASDKPNGWHWLWAIRHLKGIFPTPIYTDVRLDPLPNETYGNPVPVPEVIPDDDSFYYRVQDLIKDLGNPKKIMLIDFSGLKFKKNDDFSKFVFPVFVSFAKTSFAGIANFNNTKFQAVDFRKAEFLDYANFFSTVFDSSTNFDKAYFSDRALFNNASFRKEAIFTNTKFYQKKLLTTSFSKVTFSRKALFTDAKFHCEMRFTDARFFKNAFFKNAVFFKDVYFVKTEFRETASFKNATFHGEIAKFKMAVFSKIAIFEKTTFKHYANFTDSEFYGRTGFQQAKFENHAPRFYGATLNKQIAWDKITWPKFSTMSRVLLDDTHNKDAIRENQNSYENLAYLMEELGKYHDQHLFFREEMRCRRRLDERFLIRWAFWLYEKLSDYGYGIERAILAWALHIFIGFLVITFIAMCGGIRYQESVSCAISVSFANANPYAFFGFDSVQLTGCYDMFNKHAPILFAIIKVIQTILGIALLFLVVLTLRVRFRLK